MSFKTDNSNIQIGDIFYHHYGIHKNETDFYEVVDKVGDYDIRIKKIKTNSVLGENGSIYPVPVKHVYDNNEIKNYRLRTDEYNRIFIYMFNERETAYSYQAYLDMKYRD